MVSIITSDEEFSVVSFGEMSELMGLRRVAWNLMSTLNDRVFEKNHSCSLRPGSRERYRRRAVMKNGDCNIIIINLYTRWMRFFQDQFTTLVDMQWRWNMLIFALSYISSWFFFTIFWWIIAVAHDDLEEENLPHNQAKTGWVPCYTNLKDFKSCFLFSLEVQTTLGYSIRMVTDECPDAIFLMIFQFVFSLLHNAFVVGFLYTKVTRSKYRTNAVVFSKKAVIGERDGDMYLMFRVGDVRKSHLMTTNLRAHLLRPRMTLEGEEFTVFHTQIKIGDCFFDSKPTLLSPVIVAHKIDETSPFFDMSADDLFYEKFEILVVLEGKVQATGQAMQARTSYLSDEIQWGRRFAKMERYSESQQAYEVDFSRFNETLPVCTPLCSPKQWRMYQESAEATGAISNWNKVQLRHKNKRQHRIRSL